MKTRLQQVVLTVICGLSAFASDSGASGAVAADHNRMAMQAKEACAPYQGRKLALVIPVKPGGGFDLMARALEPFLETYSGMSVAVSNITGGSGMLAIKAVTESKAAKPAIGLINLGSFSTQMANDRSQFSFSDLAGLGVMSTDYAVWVSRKPMDWSIGTNSVMTSASSSSPYVRFGMPAKLMGLNLKPIFGFEGTGQVWMALLRGDLDLATMSDYSAARNLETGAKAVVSLTLTDRPHPDFQGVPYLAGAGGVVDAKTKGMSPAERKRQMDLAALAVILSEQARTLVASAKLQPALLTCLRNATEAALFDPALVDVAKRQKFGLNPELAQFAHAKMQRVDRALNDNREYLRSIAVAWKEGS
jgi:tripartite-type tricarboxylate transporter receptor subunit TctC